MYKLMLLPPNVGSKWFQDGDSGSFIVIWIKSIIAKISNPGWKVEVRKTNV